MRRVAQLGMGVVIGLCRPERVIRLSRGRGVPMIGQRGRGASAGLSRSQASAGLHRGGALSPRTRVSRRARRGTVARLSVLRRKGRLHR